MTNKNQGILFPFILTIMALLCVPAWGQTIKKEDKPGQNAFVPAPREFSRPIKRAREAIAEKNYRDAVAFLGEVLAISGGQDYLGYLDSNSSLAVSLRREAQRLLGSIPHRERASYELKYGIEAKQLLNEAIINSDYSKMADIVQRYFHTPSGYEATMLLGHHHLQQGRPIAAAFAFQRVVDDPQARKAHDPEASVLLATCWVLGRNPTRAAATLTDLRNRQKSGTIEYGGKTVSMFDAGTDPIDWLANLIGDSPLTKLASVNQWIMYRGNPQRNANSGTGFPLRYPRWRIPTINDPDLEKIVREIHTEFIQNDAGSIPAVQPIAVGDTLLFRSTSKLIGVDFKTGKRIWVFPDDMLFDDNDSSKFGAKDIAKKRLTSRMWLDSSFGQSSSDGRNVFIIDRNNIPLPIGSNNRQVIINRAQQQTESFANVLRAADIQREGAFRWEVGGASGLDEPELANTYFLGVPLPLDNRLYCICETQGEIRLVVLASETGKLLWSQQLATSEHVGSVNTNGERQLISATPSYSDGILICPTTANAIVAVDISTKSLIWGFEYAGTVQTNRFSFSQVRSGLHPNNSWIDETVTISNGLLVITPVNSDYMYCLDLLSGTSKWKKGKETKSMSRKDSMYVATVDEKAIYVVGNRYVRAISLGSPKELWKLDLDSHGRPSGRGYFNDGFYFLPTTDSVLIKIDLAEGKVTEKRKTIGVLGNLICYRGDVISHGVDAISVFPQVNPRRKRLDALTEAKDPLAMEDQMVRAQLLAHDKKYADAVALAESIHDRSPSASNHRMLLDLIIDFMSEDYVAASTFADKYHEQLKSRNIATYHTARVDGLIKTKKLEQALQVVFDLAAETSNFYEMPRGEGELAVISRGNLMNQRFDIWFKAQLHKIVGAGGEQSEKLMDSVRQLATSHLAKISDTQLVQYTRMVGHDFFEEIDLLSFAEKHLELNQYLACEFALGKLYDSNDRQIRAKAEGIYSALLRRNFSQSAALPYFEKLASEYGDMVCHDGKTGKQLYEEFAVNLKAAPERKPWKSGQAITQWENFNGRIDYTDRQLPMICLQATGRYHDQYDFSFVQYRRMVHVTDKKGKSIAKIPFLEEQPRGGYSSNMVAFYVILDNLMIAVYGYDIIAIDLHKIKQGQKARLWHVNTQPSDLGLNTSPYVTLFRLSNLTNSTWGNIEKYYVTNATGKRIGVISQIHASGFCYMKHNRVVCVDPLTGGLLWQQSGFPVGCDLTSDDKSVCVIEPNKRTVHVLNLADGSTVKKFDVDKTLGTVWHRSAASGIFSTTTDDHQILTRFDFASGKEIWKKKFPKKTRATKVQGVRLAALQPEGKFEMFNLETGEAEFDFNYGKTKSIYGIDVFPHGEYWRVVARRSSSNTAYISKGKAYFQGINYTIPLTFGYVQLVKRNNGKPSWAKPVYVEYFSMPEHQPTDSPVLVMARMISTRSQPTFRRIQVAGIDIRNGRELFLSSRNQSSMQMFSIAKDNEKNELLITADRSRLRVRIGDDALPPAPPAHLDLHRTFESEFEKELKASQAKTANRKGVPAIGGNGGIQAGGKKIVPAKKNPKDEKDAPKKDADKKDANKKDADKKDADKKDADKKDADKKDANKKDASKKEAPKNDLRKKEPAAKQGQPPAAKQPVKGNGKKK